MGGDLLEEPKPFAADLRFKIGEASKIPTWTHEAFDEAATHRIGDLNENCGQRAVHLTQIGEEWIAVGHDHVRGEVGYFGCVTTHLRNVGCKAIIKTDI